MKKVTIKIKDNLSPEQEAFEIAKQLAKNPLMLGNSVVGYIGQGVEVQHLKTTIEIERIPTEPTMCICSVCDCNFEKSVGKRVFINYGGSINKRLYCSEDCRKIVLNLLPENRASKTRKKLRL
jgi:uncharacterized Fe-S center protein